MLELLKQIRYDDGPIGVAVSGGADSMAALKLFTHHPKNDVTVFHVNHGTDFGERAEVFVTDYCTVNNIKLKTFNLPKLSTRPKGLSWEEYWRNARYEFFHAQNMRIITGHNLDDNVESWVFNCLHGKPHTIPYQNRNVIRPLMLNSKKKMIDFLGDTKYIEDESNQDTAFARNLIRHELLPQALKVNPGLYKVVYKKVKELWTQD